MAGNKANIIFTGLIRTPELFKKSIGEMAKLKKLGYLDKIILSTWDYELNKHSGMRDFLNENGVIMIESKEPAERGKGNIFCQMKSLEVALDSIDKNSFALKTRCDLYIEPKFLAELIKNKENLLKINRALPNGNIFRHKIWVPYFELTSLFHIGDEAFFGYAEDLKKLINYEYYDRDYNIMGGAAHVQRYIHPFLEKYSILKEYLKKHSNVGFPEDKKLYRGFRKTARLSHLSNVFNKYILARRFRILNKRFGEKGYIDALAAYYSILYSHFYIDYSGVNNETNNSGIFRRNSAPEKRTGESEIADNYNKEHIFVKTKGHIYSTDMEFLDSILVKKAKQEKENSRKIAEAISKFNSG